MSIKSFALAAALLATVASTALAQAVQVQNPWARATPAGAKTGAAYLTIVSPQADRLTGASTPAAAKAELHTMAMDNGVMKMREVGGIDLPAGQPVMLKPGGYHIMLTGLTHPLKEGDHFPLSLSFAKGGTQQVTVVVGKVGSMAPPGQSASGMPHGGMDMPMHH